MRGRWHRAGIALVLLAAGCGAAGADAPRAPALALPPCEAAPPTVAADVPGLVLPAGARVTSVTPQPPLTSVTAWVGRTPLEVRAQLEGRHDLQLLHVEDEVFEAEALLSDGAHRTYLRARAACATGSSVLAAVAPEAEASALPLPGA